MVIKRGTYKIHSVITTKYQKYPSTIMIKHVGVLDHVNKFTFVRLLNITPHDAYIITTHICTMTIAYISHKQKE